MIKEYIRYPEYWTIIRFANLNGFNLLKYRFKNKKATEMCNCGNKIINSQTYFLNKCDIFKEQRKYVLEKL